MDTPEHGSLEEVLTPEQRLSRIGLTRESLTGKDVLVMNDGDSMLGSESFGAKSVMDYNPANFDIDDDNLPFSINRFDFVIADNGILHDGVGDAVSIDMLCEVLRVCRDGGQISIYNAFSGSSYENLDVLPDNISYWLQDNTDFRVDVVNFVPDGQDIPCLRFNKKQKATT